MYPLQPMAIKSLGRSERSSQKDLWASVSREHDVRIFDFSELLSENEYWADHTHASREGADRISEALVKEIGSAI